MNKQALCIDAIHSVYPDLVVHTAEYRTGGQYNDILIVNGSLIFRFPRYVEAFHALADETAVLNAIQGKLPLHTPNPMYAHLDTPDFTQAFVGYPMIVGEAVDIYALESRYDSTTCQHLADQLADFLKALHGLPSDQLPANLAINDDRADWADLYQRIRDKLFPLMSAAGREQVANHFEPYLAVNHHFKYAPVLRHGDLAQATFCLMRLPNISRV